MTGIFRECKKTHSVKEKVEEAGEETRRKMEEMRLEGKEFKELIRPQKKKEFKEEAGEKERETREHGDTGRTVVEVKVEDTKPGKVAATLDLEASGQIIWTQMFGQTFNDVGRMDD
ncbi:hypothetical protein Bca4012_035561 [Brassica carinata]